MTVGFKAEELRSANMVVQIRYAKEEQHWDFVIVRSTFLCFLLRRDKGIQYFNTASTFQKENGTLPQDLQYGNVSLNTSGVRSWQKYHNDLLYALYSQHGKSAMGVKKNKKKHKIRRGDSAQLGNTSKSVVPDNSTSNSDCRITEKNGKKNKNTN